MVESKVIINRSDYIKMCQQLEELSSDILLFRESRDDRFLDVMENHIANMKNILVEQ